LADSVAEIRGASSVLKSGILNPAINGLLSRTRHTNTVVISDRGFPFWPTLETIDISLVDDLPRVLDVLAAIQEQFTIGNVRMAVEFSHTNSEELRQRWERALRGIPIHFEPHIEFKKRVPLAIGLIRTGDTTPYSNIIIESA
jgi:D-ribose pyranase